MGTATFRRQPPQIQGPRPQITYIPQDTNVLEQHPATIFRLAEGCLYSESHALTALH
jgi:ABC-type Mn2+/Zn2+ transport system ATPase subunit